MRRAALVLAFAAAGCQGRSTPSAVPKTPAPAVIGDAPSAPAASVTPPAEPREVRLIASTLKRVARARGLEATRSVPGVMLNRSALINQVKEHVARELPPEAIRNEGVGLQLLGFVPTDFDYEAAEYRLLQDQLAGYYEPADGTMYMANDLGDDDAEATLAHELVHALQDQHWNLAERSKYRAGRGDEAEAVSALAEGDATSAMFDVIIAAASQDSSKTALDLPDDVFLQQIRASMDHGPGASAPRVMRASLAAPYIYGTLFVHALRRRGGWREVNSAWNDPPTTSEQIMHVDKWLSREPAAPVEAPTFASLGSGWQVSDEDSEGELGARIAFEEWLDAPKAAEASSGWGGDRGVLLVKGDQAAFAWKLRFDPAKTKDADTHRANEAFRAVARGIDQTLGPPSVRDDSFDCHERPDRGPLAVARSGRDLIFAAGPANAVVGGVWSSAGSCALARRWVREMGAPTSSPSRAAGPAFESPPARASPPAR